MEQAYKVSPLETLVMMELDSLRSNRDRLSRALTLMTRDADSPVAQDRFLNDLTTLHQRSSRLERLLEGMSHCGFEEVYAKPLDSAQSQQPSA